MEVTGRDGDGDQGAWMYHEQTNSSSYSYSSSSSGTIVSYTSSYSRLSFLSIEAVMHFDLELIVDDEEEDDTYWKEMEEEERIRLLLHEFLGNSSKKCSINGGGVSVLERWFTKMGVGWVLHLADDASAGLLKYASKTRSWIRALAEITDTIRFTVSLFPKRAGMVSISEDQEEEPEARYYSYPDQFQNTEQFTQESVLKMLAFVDVIVDLHPNTIMYEYLVNDEAVPTLHKRINILLSVHNALSNALSKIRLVFHSPPSPRAERLLGEIISLLSAKETKASEATWSTMEQIRMESIEDGDNSLTSQDSQAAGSSGIHTATRSVIGYIVFLHSRYKSMAPIVSQASRLGKYVPQSRQVLPLISLVIEMVSSLQEKLANKSESFQDQALRFLFLLNNANMIKKYLINYCFSNHQVHNETVLAGKIESYMESYLQLSWAPVLSCLLNPFNPTPRFFGRKRNSTPLSKFESEFQKVYNTQKLWKVPDPELKKTLRKAIIEKTIPAYTKCTGLQICYYYYPKIQSPDA